MTNTNIEIKAPLARASTKATLAFYKQQALELDAGYDQELQKRTAEKEALAEQMAAQARLDMMRIPKRYRGYSLETYQVGNARHKQVIDFLCDYTKKNVEKMESLLIHGEKGTGKTQMICALLQTQRQAKAQYWKLSSIMRRVKCSFGPRARFSEEGFLRHLTRLPILVIDEIGRQSGHDYEAGFMFDLIDDRYDNMLPTILVSNLPMEGEESMTSYLGASVMDRINESSFEIPCEWQNYRIHADVVFHTKMEG
jgi:DNA replication protein DnaC